MPVVQSHRNAFRPTRLAAVAALGIGCVGSAQALVSWDEVTLYLTYASFTPGAPASTTFYFGTKPAIELSSFEFTLSWDNPLAAPVASGPGSVAAWAAELDTLGTVSYGFTSPQTIKGSWAADVAGGGGLFSTSYSNLARATFTFETSAALNVPFEVTIDLSNLKDPVGDTVDVGSGFMNRAVMTPVPEPQAWLSLVCGLAVIGQTLRSRKRR